MVNKESAQQKKFCLKSKVFLISILFITKWNICSFVIDQMILCLFGTFCILKNFCKLHSVYSTTYQTCRLQEFKMISAAYGVAEIKIFEINTNYNQSRYYTAESQLSYNIYI